MNLASEHGMIMVELWCNGARYSRHYTSITNIEQLIRHQERQSAAYHKRARRKLLKFRWKMDEDCVIIVDVFWK